MSPTAQRLITPDDIIPAERWAQERRAVKQQLLPIKRNRRVEVGPFATFYFENFQTMWLQVQEMLYIEKGGAAQLADELEAYNPLIPNGSELCATLMFEIDDPLRRKNILNQLGLIETMVTLSFGGETVTAVPEQDTERTNEAGKTSAVHFLHFPFTPAQIATFRQPDQQVILGFSHPQYGHMAIVPPAVRAELAKDFS